MRYIFFLIIFISIFFNKITFSKETYVVLKVNNKIITNTDINKEYRYLIALNKDLKNVEKKRIMRLSKESIIREKIKLTELLIYYDLSKENTYINEIMKNFYTKLGIKNKSEFKSYLSEYNLSYKEVKKKIEIEAAWNDLIYKKFSRQMEIDEKKIQEKVQKIISNKKKQKIYNLSEIVLEPDNEKVINNKYQKIKQNISEIGFKNSANIFSISNTAKLGGLIGWINENQLSKLIKNEIIKLNVGEYTKPIPIPGGIIIIYLNDKKISEKVLNFKEEFDKQINYEKNIQLDKFSKIYFNKIKKNSIISEL